MAGLRPAALTALACAALAGPVASAPDAAVGVTLALGAEPGAVVVRNRSATPRWVARSLLVERSRHGEGWRPVSTTLDLIARCDPRFPRRTGPVLLAPGRSVAVVPWTGWACGGQCPATCGVNSYNGEGRFRVVAVSLPTGRRLASPAFAMPARPRAQQDRPYTVAEMMAEHERPRAGPNDP